MFLTFFLYFIFCILHFPHISLSLPSALIPSLSPSSSLFDVGIELILEHQAVYVSVLPLNDINNPENFLVKETGTSFIAQETFCNFEQNENYLTFIY